MTRSIIFSAIFSALALMPATVKAQQATTENYTAQKKPKFGLVVQTKRIGSTATSVGSEFGPYLANFGNNRHNEPSFDLNVDMGVYSFSKEGLASFKNDLNHFMFGQAPLSISDWPHVSPMPSYESASNDPVTLVEALGVGTQFSIEDARGNTYDITPSVNIFGDMPILRLNIGNGLFKKK